MSVMIVTSLGEMVLDLFTDRCPLTCKNFLKLCKIKYYNGCLFHTIQKDFIAQTGDPTGTGEGGDSLYKLLYGDQARFFGDEIHLDLKHSKTGTIAMANVGENLNASQFYITLRDDLEYRDGKNTVFGEVAEGLETLTRINEVYADEKGRPYKNIRIKHTYILDDPFDDPPQLAALIPDASPEGKPKDEIVDEVRLEDDWVPMDEQISHQELEEVLREKVAHSSAVVLESIGDIPDAEMKPPDNVLFVCKLNPVTEDEDLNTIFSRFGTVTSAEVIRDFKTGDSLCYAFIEYEDKDACEQAYFKMDNALIDDRRIHVDFSQSVAKLWSQYRRKGQKGGGCFKCGSVDHIAKDCTGDPITGQQHSKYVLKDNNTQRGGKNNSRYEMVFAEDGTESPRKNKRRRDDEDEKHNHNHTNTIKMDDADHLEDRDDRKRDHPRDSSSGHRNRSKELREDERYRGSTERDTMKKDKRDYNSRKDDGGANRRDSRRDEIEYDKRRTNDVDHRHKRNVGEYERREDDFVHREHENRRQDTRVSHRHHTSYRDSKRDDRDESSYSRRMTDNDDRKGRGEERDREKRSLKYDDDHDRNRDRGRRSDKRARD